MPLLLVENESVNDAGAHQVTSGCPVGRCYSCCYYNDAITAAHVQYSIEMGDDAVETARYKSVCLKMQRCSLYTGLFCLSSNFPCNTLHNNLL